MARQPALDSTILEAALEGLEAQKARIEAHIISIHGQLGKRGPGRPPAAETSAPTRKRRKISTAVRKRMAEAQKKRWAATRAAEKKTEAPSPAKKAPARKLAAKKAAPVRRRKSL
jgi:hypothetical protein